MPWVVLLVPELIEDLRTLPRAVRVALAARSDLLRTEGPTLARPYADTLYGSRYTNMKELRFEAADGVWRCAFAFDPKRRAILLVAADKSGTSSGRFYRALIETADRRYAVHLHDLGEED
jgi:hypothetical protein